MSIEIKAPTFPESISEGTVAQWHKQPGEHCERDELLVDIETDKVVLEIVAPKAGALTTIVKAEGDTVESEEVIAQFQEGAGEGAGAATGSSGGATDTVSDAAAEDSSEPMGVSPSARKLADESSIDLDTVSGSGRDGRITKADVAAAIDAKNSRATTAASTAAQVDDQLATPAPAPGERVERRVTMTRLRARIAERLVEAQQNAAMLTTFNEVDMSAVMALRKQHQERFQARHNGTKLGFMSFFVRACVEALKRFPSVNASIDGNDVVYHGFYDIGVAVSTERGLVVPVIRDSDALGMAQIEDQISAYGRKARDGKLTLEEMSGGTFTISNGGIFGSMMSTPILNPPQTGVLGMHNITQRPVVIDGEIVARPMMYLALSYDHRLIDGREAVQFLVTIKQLIEDPALILLEI